MIKPIITLLHLKTYRDKLLATCFQDGPGSSHYKLMASWEGGQLREWRWNSLCDVLKALLKREQPLKEFWDPVKFGANGPCVTGAIQSNLFWVYAKFLLLIAGMLDAQSEWSEVCECHGHWSKHNAYRARKKYLQTKLHYFRQAENTPQTVDESMCPLKGRRAPEFANGSFVQFTETVMEVSKEKLAEYVAGMDQQDRVTLMEDWMSATEAWPCFRMLVAAWRVIMLDVVFLTLEMVMASLAC